MGGNWYFRNPNGRSAVYESLHIDTSKTRLQFEEFPVPEEWPDFPSHRLMHDYFRAYVDQFGLRDGIEFGVGVDAARRTASGWDVTLSTGETRSYTDLVVANGHHWKPRLPAWAADPATFDGVLMHSHAYVSPFEPVEIRGKTRDRGRDGQLGDGHRQRAVGAVDGRDALRLGPAGRVGAAEVPQRPAGRQGDGAAGHPQGRRAGRVARADPRAGRLDVVYGLPEPDHEPLAAHPSVSADFLTKAGSGDIHMLPEIASLSGRTVTLVDGSTVEADVIICATGYEMSFPFFDPDDVELHPDSDHRYPLFKRMIKPGVDHLFFMGLAQSSPTIVNLAEQQSKLLARLLDGTYALPSVAEQEEIMRADEAFHLEQYYAAPRHTIQIDFGRYCVDLLKEIEAGGARARGSLG